MPYKSLKNEKWKSAFFPIRKSNLGAGTSKLCVGNPVLVVAEDFWWEKVMIPATMILGKGMGHTTSQHQDLDLLKLKLVGKKEPETSPSRNNCWAFSCRISKRLIFYQKRKHQLQG